jgi:hypothetical protein
MHPAADISSIGAAARFHPADAHEMPTNIKYAEPAANKAWN